jgi:hypothetical protein
MASRYTTDPLKCLLGPLGRQSEACPPLRVEYLMVGTAQVRLCPPYGGADRFPKLVMLF